MIYLDHNASTPIKPQVRKTLNETLDLIGNPSSVHQYGRTLREKVENARELVAKAINAAKTADVVFTSGATEANMSILHGCSGVENILVSSIEHPSVRKSRDDLKFIPVTKQGIVDLSALEDMLKIYATKSKNTLISVIMVHNETGIIQPVKDIAKLAHRYDALIHTDAVQALGRLPVDMQDLNVDALTLSGHKIGAPQGIGTLIMRSDLDYNPLICGGGQEKRKRGGTENAAGIAALGHAAQIAVKDLPLAAKIEKMRDTLEIGLRKISPDSLIFGKDVPRTGTTCFFATPSLDAQALVIALDLEEIAVSAGTACSSGTTEESTVLGAMGVAEDLQHSAIRISLGWSTTQNDIDVFLHAWGKIYSRMRSTT